MFRSVKPMKISPKLPTTLRYLLITFGILLLLVGYYWFYYIPFRDAYFTSRNLRVLSDMSQSITKVLESYKGQLDKNFINPERSLSQLIITQDRYYRRSKQQRQNIASNLVKSATARIRHLDYERSTFAFGTSRYDNNRMYDSLDLQSEIAYSLSLQESGYALHLSYRGKGMPKDTNQWRGQPYSLELDANAPLSDIMAPILVPDIFDNMLIVEHSDDPKHDGRVIYQADQQEFHAIRLDSITSRLKDTWSSYHQDVTWGNTAYKIFVQPIRLALIDQPEGTETAVKEWMLIGLVDANTFGAATRRISRFDMSQWAFLFFLLLFSIPLIKLSFIGEREELKRSDLQYGVFSIFVLGGIVMFWMLSVFSDTETIDNLDRSALTPLASEIEAKFNVELDSIFKQFNALESGLTERLVRKNASLTNRNDRFPLTNYTFPQVLHPDRGIFDEGEVGAMPYPYFTQFAWINSSGRQTRKIGPRADITPLVSVAHRPYFRNIINRSYWQDSIGRPFYIEPIISFTTGENIAMVTRPSDAEPSEPVMAMSVDFISLKNPIMPSGFGYCIINESGRVLFHSDSKKNMQENFYVESNGAPDLQAAVYSKIAKHLSVDYLGNEHRLYAKPFKNIPDWTLITFVNLSEVRSSQLTALFSAFIIYTILMLVFFVVLVFFMRYRYFQSMQWFWPREAKNEQYQAYSIFLFGLAGVFYYSIFYFSAGFNVFAAFTFPLLAGLASSIFFQRGNVIPKQLAERAAFTMRGLPLSQQRHSTRIYILIGAILLLLLFFGVKWWLLWYTTIGLCIGLILNFDPITDWISTKHFPLYYARYALCGVAFFFISSILPSVAFFKMAYDTEKEILLRRGQLSLYNGLADRPAKINEVLSDRVLTKPTADTLSAKWGDLSAPIDVYHQFYLSSFFSNDKGYDKIFEEANTPYISLRKPSSAQFNAVFKEPIENVNAGQLPKAPKISIVDHVMGFLRTTLRIVDFQSWELYNDQATHQGWQWKRWLTDTKNFLFFKAYKGLYIFSIYSPFSEPNSLFWFPGLLIILIALYWVMLYFIHKIFGINLILPQVENSISPLLDGIDQNTIYIGQPNSGKSKVLGMLNTPKRMLDLRDLNRPTDLEREIKLLEEERVGYELFILDHFNLYLDEEKWNRALLNLMEKLVGKYNKTIVLVTPVDPTLMIPRLSKVAVIAQQEQERNTAAQEKVIDKTLYNRWTMLLSSFTKIYHRTHTDTSKFENEVYHYFEGRGQSNLLEHPLVIKLIEECKHSVFLQKVGLGIVHKYDIVDDFMSEEALLDEILLRAEAYYQSLWSACSIDEKVTLIHLARNNFVPFKDAKVVRLLIRKGLVDAFNYRLFNDSFAEFAISAESSNAIMEWKSNQERSWDNIRTPLITFVVAIVAFLFITQRQLFTVSLAWITTIAALIPAFFRILILLRPTTFSKRSNLAGGPVGMGEFAND